MRLPMPGIKITSGSWSFSMIEGIPLPSIMMRSPKDNPIMRKITNMKVVKVVSVDFNILRNFVDIVLQDYLIYHEIIYDLRDFDIIFIYISMIRIDDI